LIALAPAGKAACRLPTIFPYFGYFLCLCRTCRGARKRFKIASKAFSCPSFSACLTER
jgi:hypothetical protein